MQFIVPLSVLGVLVLLTKSVPHWRTVLDDTNVFLDKSSMILQEGRRQWTTHTRNGESVLQWKETNTRNRRSGVGKPTGNFMNSSCTGLYMQKQEIGQ